MRKKKRGGTIRNFLDRLKSEPKESKGKRSTQDNESLTITRKSSQRSIIATSRKAGKNQKKLCVGKRNHIQSSIIHLENCNWLLSNLILPFFDFKFFEYLFFILEKCDFFFDFNNTGKATKCFLTE